MFIRGTNYTTIRSLLLMSEINLSSLNDEEQKIVINFGLKDIEQFKIIILELITDYERFLNDSNLEKYETELSNTCLQFAHELVTLDDTVNIFQKRVVADVEKLKGIVRGSDNFLFDLGKIFQVSENIKEKQLNILNYKDQLKAISNPENFGMKKIENCLSFCINLFLNYPNIKYLDKQKNETYFNVLTLLGDFYYNHGKNLFIVEKDNSLISSKRVPDNIAISLILFMMTGSTKSSLLENACYVHLLDKVLNRKIADNVWMKDFDLEEFAIKSPMEFTILYRYLFNENQLFSRYLHINANENIYLNYKSGLFNLYMSFASKQLTKSAASGFLKEIYESDEKYYRDQAKELLLSSFKNGLSKIINILDAHFSDIDVGLKIALFCLKNNDPRSLFVSEKIYLKISTLKPDELLPHAYELSLLFKSWLNQEVVKWKQIAFSILLFYVKKNITIAESVLIEYAKNNIDGAKKYSDLIIEINRKRQIHTVKVMLNYYRYTNDSHILFNLYKISIMEYSPDYEILFKLAEMDNEQAKEDLYWTCKHKNSFELKKVLLDGLANGSLMAFQLLNENCDGPIVELELAIFALHHQIADEKCMIDRTYDFIKADTSSTVLDQDKIFIFYEYLSCSTNDPQKLSFIVDYLKSHLGKNVNAYLKLLFHARRDYSVAIDLIKFCLNEAAIDHDKLTTLKNILELYHHKNLSTEGKYYLYSIKKIINHLIDLDVLDQLLKEDLELAITEFILIFDQFKAQKEHGLVLRNQKIDIKNAVLYFENELVSYALNDGMHQYEVCKMMSLYYLRQKEFLRSEKFIQICLDLNIEETFNSIFIDLNQDDFSASFKSFYLDKKKIYNGESNIDDKRVVSGAIKSKIMLFGHDKIMRERLENEKFELKKIIASTNIPDDRRYNILEHVRNVRDSDGLSLVQSQLFGYLNERECRDQQVRLKK